MVLKPFLIAPYKSGFVENVDSWLLPEDAFESLVNAYVWRGKVKKRPGTSHIGGTDLNSRLRIKVGTTDAVTGNLPSTQMPGSKFKVGQIFSVGSTIFTVSGIGNPVDLLTTGIATAKYSTTFGTLEIEGNSENTSTDVYFYPADPVMGLRLREQEEINFEDTIGFDTQFAYIHSAAGWERLGDAIWSGNDSDFYWSTNYRGTNPSETFFYAVNYKEEDKVKYIPEGATTWTTFRPQLNNAGTIFLESGLIVVGFKDRLLVLNTIEKDGAADAKIFQNRVRFSKNGNPTDPVTSFVSDVKGLGGYQTASTEEAIVSVEFIKDRLIVYFERSTWELVYTGDKTIPFRFQQINSELGAESTHSIVGFDSNSVAVGNIGIHSCNGVSVSRIDQKIPDEIFKIHNLKDGPKRVYGIIDYYRELVYWTFPEATGSLKFPNRVLIWNYENDTWAFFEDSITCFGAWQNTRKLTWAIVGQTYPTWGAWNSPWESAKSQGRTPDIIAGNQQGFVFTLNADDSSSSESLYISKFDVANGKLTVVDHNLNKGDYVAVSGVVGVDVIDLQGNISSINDRVYKINRFNSLTLHLQEALFTGTYKGGGKLTKIPNLNIVSAKWNPGTQVGKKFKIPYIDLLMDRTSSGEVSINYIIDYSSYEMPGDGSTVLGNNILLTRPESDTEVQVEKTKIWHRFFIQSQAQFLQIKIFLSDAQMKDLKISQESKFQLNGTILYVEPTGRLIG